MVLCANKLADNTVDEGRSGADDWLRGIGHPPAAPGRFDESECYGRRAGLGAVALGDLGLEPHGDQGRSDTWIIAAQRRLAGGQCRAT
jgi:hypothetical protein